MVQEGETGIGIDSAHSGHVLVTGTVLSYQLSVPGFDYPEINLPCAVVVVQIFNVAEADPLVLSEGVDPVGEWTSIKLKGGHH